MSDLGIELGDGVCDFEKVPPAQLCPSAKKKLAGSHGQFRGSILIRKGVTTMYRCPGVRVRVRVRVRCFVVTRGHKWVLYGSVA